jgi:uncharacterized protein (DUF1684 family)
VNSRNVFSIKVLVCITLFFVIACVASKSGIFEKQLYQYRETYKKSFLTNERSPLASQDLDYLDFYKANPAWNLTCPCALVKDSKPFEMPTYSGVTRTYILYAVATCKTTSKPLTLHLYKNLTQPVNPLYKNLLFLPFKDETNGDESYGGGRYLNVQVTDIVNDTINIDFNKCYNPWCAYSDGFNCPIPPVANHIEMKIEAGEKKFKGLYKKSSK